MNTSLISFVAAGVIAALAVALPHSLSSQEETTSAVPARIVDLPAITVRPDPADLAYYRSHKIVDLATVTVRPEAQDLAYFLANAHAQIVDFPVVTVRPSTEDVQVATVEAIHMVQQVASR